MKNTRSAAIALATLLAACTGAPAWGTNGKPVNPDIDEGMIRAGFLGSHPDLRYRLLGLEQRRQGKHADAFRFFQRAAYYGDKPSQGMLAEMLWNGTGTAADRPQAYAWMDLAAERGYEGFLVLRERYWNALGEVERDDALAQGEAIYAKYGDAAAQPRLARVLRRERLRMTGSRTGSAGTLKISVPGPAGPEEIDGSKFYDEKFWNPKMYRAWHDGIWMKPRIGQVTVGEAEQVKDAGHPASRIPAVKPTTDTREPATPDVDEAGLGTPKGG
ncbi:tetratricopeptide repeat protein [Thermomonas aquatica]|jgi:hypothetical protein|uniref:Sel1 repeat family protein n=1 Tax=Thermomonas aquatica TaxID=2202149 RepID=A0A5B7ZU59_9GAMM|nr:sel1 repeat family protein [Thermomonas aquatica]QDA58319.1 sel1 repeat family protein [Thermomonas aquatica]